MNGDSRQKEPGAEESLEGLEKKKRLRIFAVPAGADSVVANNYIFLRKD